MASYNKLTQELIEKIRQLRKDGIGSTTIGRSCGVSKTTVLRHCSDIKLDHSLYNTTTQEQIKQAQKERQSGKSLAEISKLTGMSKTAVAKYTWNIKVAPHYQFPEQTLKELREDRRNGFTLRQLSEKYKRGRNYIAKLCGDIVIKPIGKTQLTDDEISSIRNDYQSLKNVKAVAKLHKISRDLVSKLCHDLILIRIAPKPKPPRKFHNKQITCKDCGKPIDGRHVRCRDCYVKFTRINKINKAIKNHNSKSTTNGQIVERLKNQPIIPLVDTPTPNTNKQWNRSSRWAKPPVEICSKNPIGKAHHYILDNNNLGVCKYCGFTKQHGMVYSDTPRK